MKKINKLVLIFIILMLVCISIILYSILNKSTIGTDNNKFIAILDNEESDNNNNFDETSKNEIILDTGYYLSLTYNISDKDLRNENSDYIIIGTVQSIEGAINYNPKENIYTCVQTIGEINVNKIIKGEIKKDVIPFIRLGGEISFEQFEKGLVDSQKEKLDLVKTLSIEEKKTKYVSETINRDIKIETGKTYLMYLKYDSDYDKYGIIFMEHGLREINMSTTSKDSISKKLTEKGIEEIMVKNNSNGEWETISDTVGIKNINR